MKANSGKEQTYILVGIGLVLMMGLPILIGYGVVPYTNFGVEVVAVLGMGVLLVACSLLVQQSLPSARALRVALASTAMLMLLTLAKATLGPISAVNLGTLLIYLGYMGSLLGAIWTGHVLMNSLAWPWVEKVIIRTLIFAAIVAALGSLMQYFAIDGSWMGLSPSAEPGRTYGFVRQPNHQATFLSMGMATLLYLRTRKKLGTAAWYLLSVLLVAALVTTASRTGVLQLLLLCGAYVWASWADGRFRALRAAAEVLSILSLAWAGFYAGAVLLDIPFYGLSKLDRMATEGVGVRRELWRGAWELILQRPWFGHVIHSFMPTFMIQGHALQTRMVFENAHNMFLQIGFEFGLPVAIGSYALLGRLFFSLGMSARNSDVARLMGGLLLCTIVYAQFEYPLWYSHFLFPFGLCVGIYLSSVDLHAQRTPESGVDHGSLIFGRASALVAAVLGLLLLVGAVTANRDFYRLTPVFARFDDSSLSAKIEKVGQIFWFADVLTLAKYQIRDTPNASLSKEERLQLLKQIGCERDEPWYQFPTIRMLAEDGFLDDARWMVYLIHDLNPKAVPALIEYMSASNGPRVSELITFALDPHPVAPSSQFFFKICYGQDAL